MTLVWVERLDLYIGWQEVMCSRKPHFCCTSTSMRAWYGPLELSWVWTPKASMQPCKAPDLHVHN